MYAPFATTPAAIDQLRRSLVESVWGGPSLPTLVPSTGSPAASPLPLTVPATCTVHTVTVNGSTSTLYRLVPSGADGRWCVVHLGHWPSWQDSVDGGYSHLADALLGAGWSLWLVPMPMPLSSHNALGLQQTATFNPMRYFLEPAIAAINAAEATGATDLAMTGVSGGGWTTTVVAALDTRVRLSFPVAGSYPMELRENPGDWEQIAPSFYGLIQADYLSLYILGSTGPGRRQVQITNYADPCCFRLGRSREYQDTIHAIAPGYLAAVDYENPVHSLSVAARDAFLLPITEGLPVPTQIADNSSPQFSASFGWTLKESAGRGGTLMHAPPAVATCSWDFTIARSGDFQVYATWKVHPNRATNTPFYIVQGGDIIALVRADQRNTVWDMSADGSSWKLLWSGHLDAGPVRVLVANSCPEGAPVDGYVIADAVLIRSVVV